MNEYNLIDPYGSYQTKGLDPYEMLMKMSSWNNELRSTLTQVNSDLGAVESTIVQQADLIAQRVTYEDYTGEIVSSMIVQDPYSINLLANQLNLQGLVTVTDLQGNGTTIINGANIMTKTILAGQIAVAELSSITANLGFVTAGYIQGVVIDGSTFVSVGVDSETSQVQTMALNSGVMNFDSGNAYSVISTRTARFSLGNQSATLRASNLELRDTGTGRTTTYGPNGISSNGTFTIANLLVSYASSAGNVTSYNGNGNLEIAVNASGNRIYFRRFGAVLGYVDLAPDV